MHVHALVGCTTQILMGRGASSRLPSTTYPTKFPKVSLLETWEGHSAPATVRHGSYLRASRAGVRGGRGRSPVLPLSPQGHPEWLGYRLQPRANHLRGQTDDRARPRGLGSCGGSRQGAGSGKERSAYCKPTVPGSGEGRIPAPRRLRWVLVPDAEAEPPTSTQKSGKLFLA